MRVGFVSQWFPPEQGTTLPASIAESLVSLGHSVDVLTGYPNYPSGQLHQGYRIRPYQREVLSEGLTVHRAPLYPSHDTSATRRFLNYTTFALGATAVARTKFPEQDVWLVYSSPATAALPAMLARDGAPYVLLIQDLWPDSVTHSALLQSKASTLLAERLLNGFCNLAYRRARRIGVISPSMRKILQGRGVPSNKIRYTPNWAILADGATSRGAPDRHTLGLPRGGAIFLYAGNLGQLQCLDQLVVNWPASSDAQLVLMGTGIAKEQLALLAADRPNVHIRDAVPASTIALYQEAADVLVVSLANTPLLRATMPSKMQSSLAAGRPILVHGAGDVADLVTSVGAGRAASPGVSSALACAVDELAGLEPEARAAMGARAASLYHEQFAADRGSRRIAEMLEEAHRQTGLDY